MAWQVQLKGNGLDLLELSKCLTDPALKIRKSGGNYVLESIRFDSIHDSELVSELSHRLLALIYGAGRLAFGIERRITIGGIVELREGKRIFHESLRDALEIRATMSVEITRGDGTVEIRLPADNVAGWVSLAESDERVAKVLRLIGPGITSFAELYKVFEVIADDVGGRIWDEKWASKDDVRRFKHTANSPGALGDDARHGAEHTTPPVNPMPWHEAAALVRKVILEWIGFKMAQRPGPSP